MKFFQTIALLAISLFVLPNSINSQFPCEPSEALQVHETGKISMMHGPNGKLWTAEHPMVLNDKSISDNPINIFKNSGLWLLGVDPGGNTKGAIDSWRPGYLDEFGVSANDHCENFDKIWEATKEELDAFDADYFDNGAIDGDHPSVFSWPGNANPNFEAYNGFELIPHPWLSDFEARSILDLQEEYNPESGDIPRAANFYPGQGNCPSSIQWWTVNDNSAFDLFNPARAVITVTAYSYDHLFENASMVFYKFTVVNMATEDLVDMSFGLWLDPDLGCPEDDYIGYNKEEDLVYVYNANDQDGDGNGNCLSGTNGLTGTIPQIAIKRYKGFENSEQVEQSSSSFIPFLNDADSNSPYALPTDQWDYINVLLGGEWQDGTTMTQGGLGVSSDNPETNFAFTDSPDDPDGWSMCTANFPSGDKSFVLTNTVDYLPPSGGNTSTIIGVYVSHGKEASACPSIDDMVEEMDAVYNFDCPANPFVGTKEVSSSSIKIYPNPSKGTIHFETAANEKIATVNIYDLSGKLIQAYEGIAILNNSAVNFASKGFFLAEIVLENGEVIMEKVLFQ